tara:strand:+ start:206 stop:592 length:387 start_codon:yes stop_codon:yes gene_type:complete
MAYSATATLTHIGGRDYKLVISETEAGAATEATINGLPTKGRVLAQLCTKASGTATTVAPILVTAAGSSAAVETVCQATAAADQSNSFEPPSRYHVDNGTLYHRTVCDTSGGGAANAVTTVYFIQAGW